MVIIAGYLAVDDSERGRFREERRDVVSRARSIDGCIHLAITADSLDPTRSTTPRSGSRPQRSKTGAPKPTRPTTGSRSFGPRCADTTQPTAGPCSEVTHKNAQIVTYCSNPSC